MDIKFDDLGCVRSVEHHDPYTCFASTLTTFDFALKERYMDADLVENLTMADRPLLSMLTKDEDHQGDQLVVPVIRGNPQGIAGSTLATAQGNTQNVAGEKFNVTMGDYFGSVSIGDKVLKASRGNPGAFLQNKTAETDGLYEQMSDNLAIYCWGNGGNSLGRRSSASTNVITLSNPQDCMNFEVGMTVVASSADGSATGDALRTGSTTVASIDRNAGTVTLTSAAGITSFADNDYLFRSGDFFGNTGVVVVKGVQTWVYGSTSPPALYGVTRTTDTQRLAGCYVSSTDVSGLNIEERIRKLGAYMSGRYKTPGASAGFLHPEDWQTLETSLQARGNRALTDSSTKFGYMKIEVVMGGKIVPIYPDRYCPKGTFFALRLQNWKLSSMEKLIHPLNGDGLTMLRASTTNDYEFRLVSYPALWTNAPGYNGRVVLT